MHNQQGFVKQTIHILSDYRFFKHDIAIICGLTKGFEVSRGIKKRVFVRIFNKTFSGKENS